MQMKPLIPTTLCALLVASPFAMAQQTPDPAATTTAAGSPPASEAAPPGTQAQPAAPGGMGIPGPGMMGGGMMKRMGKGRTGGQPEQGPGMMGGGGMMGMMHGGKGGSRGMMGCGGKGHGMPKHYKRLMGRLDLLEARMAKIETMLERLLER